MTKLYYLLLAVVFYGCTCSTTTQSELNADFFSDLGSENNRIEGDLSLDYFNDDLTSLTYDYYLTYITKNEAPSAKGLSKLIKQADYHYFTTGKEYFIIALYYRESNTIICDNSNTAFLDSVKTYNVNDSIPDLSFIANKLKDR